jgi:hypothetical protein
LPGAKGATGTCDQKTANALVFISVLENALKLGIHLRRKGV